MTDTMKLPLFISVPHAGTSVPPEVSDLCVLSQEDIFADADAGAEAIYSSLQEYAEGFSIASIARSIVDFNRAPDQVGGDGVIKDHTCWNVPVYRRFPDDALIRSLLGRYYHPYHEQLTAAAVCKGVRLGVDCHTMAPVGPPVGPDPGRKRPLVCVSNGNGSCPEAWTRGLADCLTPAFGEHIAINRPFRGGYTIRSHGTEMPWIQVEISRTGKYTDQFKRDCLLEGLKSFCNTVLGGV